MPGLTNGEPRPRLDDQRRRERPRASRRLFARSAGWSTEAAAARRRGMVAFARLETPRTRDMPARYEVVLRRMVEFSQDVTRHSGLIDSQSNDLLARDIESSSTKARAPLRSCSNPPTASQRSISTHAQCVVRVVCIRRARRILLHRVWQPARLGSDDLSVLGTHGVESSRAYLVLQPRRLAASHHGLSGVGGGTAGSVLLGDCGCRASGRSVASATTHFLSVRISNLVGSGTCCALRVKGTMRPKRCRPKRPRDCGTRLGRV